MKNALLAPSPWMTKNKLAPATILCVGVVVIVRMGADVNVKPSENKGNPRLCLSGS